MKSQPEITDSFAGASIGSAGGQIQLGENDVHLEIPPEALAIQTVCECSEHLSIWSTNNSRRSNSSNSDRQVHSRRLSIMQTCKQLSCPATWTEAAKPTFPIIFWTNRKKVMYGSVKVPFYLTTWRNISSCQVDLKAHVRDKPPLRHAN